MTRIRSRALFVGLAPAVLLSFVIYWAYAHSSGITGQTLKSSPVAGCGAKITGGGSCHGTLSSSAVNVKIEGPKILGVGKTGTFTFSDSGAAGSGGGFDIAVSNGSLSSTSASAQLLNQELTHKSGITVPFSINFSLAPSAAGQDTIFANGKGSSFSAWNWAPSFIIRVGPPPAPVPDSPLAASAGVQLTPRLVWSGIAGPRWTVEVATDTTFASPVVHQTVVGDTTYAVKAGVLLNDTVYYWHVSATDTGGTSPYFRPARSFRTVVAAPPAPLLAFPDDKTFLVVPNIQLRWHPALRATGYHMQVSTDSTFLTASRDSAGIVDTTFRTGNLAGGTRYYWRVAGANAGGTGTWSAVRSFTLSLEGVEPVVGQVPTAFALSQNYPNPFNPATKIAFSLPASSSVRLAVFDIQGREVAVVAQGELAAGVYTTTFDAGASHLASGVYFYRLTASAGGKAYVETRKLLLVR